MGIYVSGPELVYAGSVIVACGASAYGALIASHSRENKRRARQSWRRADKRWGEVHQEVLALEEIKAELAETRTDRVMDTVITREQLHEAARLNAWCPCKVIPQHLVKDHPTSCDDPRCTDVDCTDEHIAEEYTAKVLDFRPLIPENARTEGRLIEVDNPVRREVRHPRGETCDNPDCPCTVTIPMRYSKPEGARSGDEKCIDPDCPAATQYHQVFEHSFVCACNAPVTHTVAMHEPGWGDKPCFVPPRVDPMVLMPGDTCSDCGRPATLVRHDGSRSCSACVPSARLTHRDNPPKENPDG